MFKKTCSILQPHYLPWIGYFDLIKRSDVFVFLDDVQYIKREWKNRNKIRKNPKSEEVKWLSVPIDKKSQKKNINEVEIFREDNEWRKQHIIYIKKTYQFSPHFDEFSEGVFSIIKDEKIKNLCELNVKLISKACDFFSIKKNFCYSSEFGLKEKREFKLLEICKKLNCDNFLANNRTLDYADVKIFSDNNINIKAQDYHPEKYKQKYNDIALPWIPFLSWVDYIFNKGNKL